ncbi:MAG: exodeoxyribonuclease V subunit gamma [Gammaproteobacteria bacterium]|nr:exodeoxyribonuclease V subunit gamma [Gammaproteobacteria bacterium]
MLNICHSNSINVLLRYLADSLQAHPLSSPFEKEIIIAPSPAMARWVNIELCQQNSVAANMEYPLPSSFIWKLARGLLPEIPDKDPLNITGMTWKAFRLLPELIKQPEFKSLKNYLADDENGIKRWQLSKTIADTFDRYQLYRPDMIRQWSQQQVEDDGWQSLLWQAFVNEVDHYRVASIDKLLKQLSSDNNRTLLDTSKIYPQRISFFAVPSLPPLMMDVIHVLSNHLELNLYLHSPTPEFWADLKSQKVLARKRLEQPENYEYWETGNDLLASWGKQGQALQDLLLLHDYPVNEIDAFVPPENLSLLGQLQSDIYHLKSDSKVLECDDDDRSLQIHICHSPLREMQVLHDQLLNLLEQERELRPEDILVMIPEINLYAPYIEAVFHRDEEERRPYIPWNLSDISLQDEHPLINIFLQLLRLSSSRFSYSEIVSYLDVPELAQNYKLTEVAIEQIRVWLKESNVRWGVDASHKAELDLPEQNANTWKQAEQRLFGGYALGDIDLFEGIAPIGTVEGINAEILGHFWHLFSKLDEYRNSLNRDRTPVGWQGFLNRLLDDFFNDSNDEEGRLQKIRDCIANWVEQTIDVDELVSIELVLSWLAQELESQTRRGRYFTGGITFCGMRPMRSVPFKVICLSGMHDQAFPAREQATEFDLMSSQIRLGDPRKGDEDRYLFLQTLLCAQQYLYISYIGRDIRTNEPRTPSVLVQELLDYVDEHYHYKNSKIDKAGKISDHISVSHSLQPFSPKNYQGDYASFDKYWFTIAQQLSLLETSSPESINWPDIEFDNTAPFDTDLSIKQLLGFIRHPIKYFINTGLNIYLAEDKEEEDVEVFHLEGLDKYKLSTKILESEIKGTDISIDQFIAEGALPHGNLATQYYSALENELDAQCERLSQYSAIKPETLAVSINFTEINTISLNGTISGYYPEYGLIRYKASQLRGPDILMLWIEHLLLCLSDNHITKISRLYFKDKEHAVFSFKDELESDVAYQLLTDYVSLFMEGRKKPLLILPKSSYEFANCESTDKGMQNAWKAWLGNSFSNIAGDCDDAYIQLITRGAGGDPLDAEEFTVLANRIYSMALQKGIRE